MSLWYESLVGRLGTISKRYVEERETALSLQREQALCIFQYLSMGIPRQWWENSIQEGAVHNAEILHGLYGDLQKMPQIAQRIHYPLLVALAFIEDPEEPGRRTHGLSLEEFLAEGERVLAKRPDLRRLGEKIRDLVEQQSSAAKPADPIYGLFRHDNRMHYADTFGAYVFQVEPFPAAWEKSGQNEKWKRTRKLPLNLQHLALGRLHKDPIGEMELSNCRLLRWNPTNTEFAYEPDWSDSVPLKEWQNENQTAPLRALFNETLTSDEWAEVKDWATLVEEFFRAVRVPLLARLKQFPTGSWELLDAAYQWEGFEDLMDANPALAVCLALRVRVGKQPGVHRKPLDYGSLVGRRQREIAAAIGFGDSEAVVSILKKVVPDACTSRDLSCLSDLIRDPLIMPHLQNAREISGPAIFLLQDPLLRGKLGGGLISEISREYPLSDDITSTAEGVKQLRGGAKLREFTKLYLEMRDLVRFNPDLIVHSLEDYQAKHAAMVRKLNEGSISNRTVHFPEPPFSGTEQIQPITSTDQLAREGKEMQHCIKSYLRDIFKGLVAVYRVTSPERATLSIERGPKAWRLGQLKLHNNQEPSAETVAFVHGWLKANGVRFGKLREVRGTHSPVIVEQPAGEALSKHDPWRPPAGRWTEGRVDVRGEHFKIYHGDDETCIALVGRDGSDERSFVVQFLLEAVQPEIREKIEHGLRVQLDFYLVQKPERHPWAYMRYHCGTYANAYSEYHWGYCAESDQPEEEGRVRKIEWVTVKPDDIPDDHGLNFLAHIGNKRWRVAFLEGFRWMRDASADARIYCIEPDRTITRAMIDELKRKVEGYLQEGEMPLGGDITDHIVAYASA